MNRAAAAAFVLMTSMGCVSVSKYTGRDQIVFEEDELRDRAAFDMDCPAKNLAVVALGSRFSAGVTGCGKRLAYNRIPGSWAANVDVSTSN